MPTPLVSVVIPAYDVAEHLPQCLDSLLQQSIGFERLEVIAVDDGSRDGTGALLDAFAAGRPNVQVLHQVNSGGPGAPRNLGLSRATADHVFFLDPDDHLGPEALERLLAAAQRNDADVALGKIVGVGRQAPRLPFERDVERGDLLTTRAVWSLSCQKLFRRQHVADLRFLEGVRLGEDQEFVMGAYLTARVISVVAGHPCYYLVLREAGGNATRTHADPAELYAIVRRVLALLDRHVPEGPLRDEVLGRYFSVEVSGRLGANILRLPVELRDAYLREVRPLALQYFDARQLAGLPALDRVRGHLLREGTVAQLEELAEFEVRATRPEPLVVDGRTCARYPFLREEVPDDCYDITDELALDHCAAEVAWSAGGVTVEWQPYAPALHEAGLDWSLALDPRAGGDLVQFDADPARRVTVPLDAALPDGVWGLLTVVRRGDEVAQLPLGAAGTTPALAAPWRRLVGDRVATLYRDRRGGLQLVLARSGDGFAVRTTRVQWDAAALLVECVMAVDGLTADDAVEAQLLLRHRATGREVAVPAQVTRPGAAAARVVWDGFADGLWDATLRLTVRGLQLTGRLVAADGLPWAQLAADRPVVPYATVNGNLSLDVGATRRTPPPTAAATATWGSGPVLRIGLQVEGVPVAPRLVLRERNGQTVEVPVHAAGIDVDLADLVARGELTPGTWTVELRDGRPAGRRVPVAVGDVATEARRWWSRTRLLSAQPRRLSGGLAVVVSEVSLTRAVRRRLSR